MHDKFFIVHGCEKTTTIYLMERHMASSDVSNRFTRTVFKWRTIASCIWLLILSFPGLLVFRFIAESLLWQSWTVIPSLRNAGFICTYIFLLVLISIIYPLTYTAELPVFKTRLTALWNVLHPNHFVIVLILSVLGALCSYSLTELIGYTSGLWHTCEINSLEAQCLNEYLLFFTAYGAVCGFIYGCGYFFFKEYFLVFPSLQKGKLFHLRGHLLSHVYKGLVWSLKVLRVFYPLYFMCGSFLRSYFASFLKLLPDEGPGLDSLSGLVNLRLFLHLILIGTFMHLSWNFGLRLFRTYQTQTVFFPVVTTFTDDSDQRLEIAVKSDLVLLKLLGFLDLYQISLHSPQRRKDVFSLNTTGQPLIWNSVCDQCLHLVNMLAERLTIGKKRFKLTTPAATPPDHTSHFKEVASPSLHTDDGVFDLFVLAPKCRDVVLGSTLYVTARGWPSIPVDEVLGTPGSTRRRVFNEKARLWSYSPGHSVEKVPTHSTKKGSAAPLTMAFRQFNAYISSIPKRMKERLKKKPFFIYFLNELPDATNQELFADCQLQVWAITSISELAVASYTEDVYGVVQRSLTSIIESLIDLSQALDKHVKAPLSSSKSTKNIRVALEANGRYAIKTAVQTSLFRLATTFSKERRSIQLSPDHHQYWSKYFVAL